MGRGFARGVRVSSLSQTVNARTTSTKHLVAGLDENPLMPSPDGARPRSSNVGKDQQACISRVIARRRITRASRHVTNSRSGFEIFPALHWGIAPCADGRCTPDPIARCAQQPCGLHRLCRSGPHRRPSRPSPGGSSDCVARHVAPSERPSPVRPAANTPSP